MNLLEELQEQYQKARKEKDNKNERSAQKAYDRIINQVKNDVQNAKTYSSFNFDIFGYDDEVKTILCEKLKKDGLSIRFDDCNEYLEISGWVEEKSNWEKFLV